MEVTYIKEEGILAKANVNGDDSLKELKLQIAQDMQVPVTLINVSFRGVVLKDDKKTLNQYGMSVYDNHITVNISKVLL